MIIEHRAVIAAPAERVWDLMMDVPAVSRCVPGIESVEQVADDVFAGKLAVKLGLIVVRLEGQVTLSHRDREAWTAVMDVEGVDRRIRGAVNARATMVLQELEAERTELRLRADTSILGKLGEFGQAVMRRRADQILSQFVANMSRRLTPPA